MDETATYKDLSLLDELAAVVAEQLKDVRGTQASRTIDLDMIGWNTYYQMASYEGDDLLFEVPGATTSHNGLSRFEEEWLAELGFQHPEPRMPNWWIGMEQGRDPDIEQAARAVVRALVEVHGVDAGVLAETLGVARPQRDNVDASTDPLLLEVVRLVPELREVTVALNRLHAVPDDRRISVELSRDRGVLRAEYLGPPYLDDFLDDSDWSLYFAMVKAGAIFHMFYDPDAIAHRIRRAIDLQRQRAGGRENPFRRRRH